LDILADPHVNPKTPPAQKIKLAMAIGDNRHYRVNEILRRHWRQTASNSKFADIDELLDEICSAVPNVIESVSGDVPSDFPASVSDDIFLAMKKRAIKLSK
jgi:serine/threonine-protein kinase HipA